MESLLQLIKDKGIKVVDLRFTDMPGVWQHFSVPAQNLNQKMSEEGIGFDGSSIQGFQGIQESDMVLKPVPDRHFIDPFSRTKTLNVICNVFDPVSQSAYSRDPRNIAYKAEEYLKQTGIADIAYLGPEAEFYILDSIMFDQGPNFARYEFDSGEGFWIGIL